MTVSNGAVSHSTALPASTLSVITPALRLPDVVEKLSKCGNDNYIYQFYRDFLDGGYSLEEIIGDPRSINCYPGYRTLNLFDKLEEVSLNHLPNPEYIEWVFNIPDCDSQLSIKENLITKKKFFGRKTYVLHFDKRTYRGTHCIGGDFYEVDIELINGESRIKGKVFVMEGDLFMQDLTGKSTKIVHDFLFWLNENKDVQPDIVKINDKEVAL